MALIINSENFEKEINQSNLPVVIDVYADWCGPCQMLGPIFEEVSKELSAKYKFAKLNIDEERDLAIKYNVSSIPTLIFIKEGKVVAKETGYLNKVSLKSKIESLLG